MIHGRPKHRESPIKRVNPSGQTRWVARYTDPDGRRRSAGTFKLQRAAQEAIDAAYETPILPTTVGAFLEVWPARYPRADRTNTTNTGRIRQLLEAKIEGRALRSWPLRDLRRRHALELVDFMLREQGRATTGAQNILRAFSAMAEDAITDEVCDVNPFKGVRVRANDPRVLKQRRQPRVYTWEQMHAVAAAAGPRDEPMIRTLADCGLRIGELFALQRTDLGDGMLRVTGSAWEGRVVESSTEKNHNRDVPVPPGCMAVLRRMPPRIDSKWLFPSPRGMLWRYSNWQRRVWQPAIAEAGLNMKPHEMRHSFVSLLRASGVDDADLAAITGHGVGTLIGRYTHPLQRSFDQVRGLVG